jgi:hypothetical protein
MSSRFRRPSPALVLATIAVFMLGAGGATAASKLNGKNIKKGSVPLSALSKGAKKGLTGATGATGAQGVPGIQGAKGDKGDPGTPATRLWGVVSAGGSLVRNSGVQSVSHGDGAADQGIYDLVFTQSVANCAVLTSIGQPGTAVGTIAGFISHRLNSDNSVRVETADATNTPTNYPFHVAVFCP